MRSSGFFFLILLSIFAFGNEGDSQSKSYFHDKNLSVSFGSEPVTDLDINAYSGNYRFVPSLNKTVTVKIKQLSYSSVVCNLQPIQTGGQIIVVTEDARKNRCSPDFEIEIPEKLNVTIKLNSGEIELGGINDIFTIDMDSGGVHGTNFPGKLLVNIEKGDVSLAQTQAQGQISVGKGNIDLNYSAIPSEGSIRLTTKVGNVLVTLPKIATEDPGAGKRVTGFEVSTVIETGEAVIYQGKR